MGQSQLSGTAYPPMRRQPSAAGHASSQALALTDLRHLGLAQSQRMRLASTS